jgi:hypothetical protein
MRRKLKLGERKDVAGLSLDSPETGREGERQH